MKITKREIEVLQLLTEGYTSKEIAQRLFLSYETIISHRENVKRKLKARNTAGLISKAFRQGIMVSMLFAMVAIGADSAYGQTRNIHIDGSGEQYQLISTTGEADSKAGIEFVRGSQFSGTDWRIQNNGGNLEMQRAVNNFMTPGDTYMRLTRDGVLNLFEGSNAVPNNNESGILLLGDPTSTHIALDNNGITARTNETGSALLLQTGLNQGDVGIGTSTPQAKLGIEDSGFQMRLGNADDLSNEWYIGASRSSWTVGADKLVFSPTSSSGNAMLILDSEDDIVSVRNNRLANVADPTNDLDAVNYRTLMEFSRVSEITSDPNHTFSSCATHCRFLSTGGHDDWKIPSMHEIVQFIDPFGPSGLHWTTDHGGIYNPNPTGGIIFPQTGMMAVFDLATGEVGASDYDTSSIECACVR